MSEAATTTQDSTGAAAAATEQSSAGAGTQPPASGQAAASGAESSRPEGLPDAFWDATTNSLKTGDLLGKFNELSAFKAAEDSRKLAIPESADKYELKMPEGTQIPEGMEWQFNDKDPLLGLARNAAHKAGLDQAGFEQNVLKPFIELQAAAAHAQQTQIAEMTAAADKELGAQATARRDAVKTYVGAKFGASHLDTIEHFLPVPGFVKLMEQVIRNDSSGGMPAFKGTGREAGGKQDVSDEDWAKMTPSERMSFGIKQQGIRASA